MVREDRLGIEETGVNREMFVTGFTKVPKDFFPSTETNHIVSNSTNRAAIFLHMPHLTPL